MAKSLSPKHRRFVAEYLKDQNGTQAAIRAGYSPRSANVHASRMLSKDSIKAEIEKRLGKIEEKALVDAAYVIGGLKEVSQRCMQRVPVMYFDKENKEMVQETAAFKDPKTGELREEGVWEFDSAGANRSLELLGKHLKLFTESVDLTSGGKKLGGVVILPAKETGKKGSSNV